MKNRRYTQYILFPLLFCLICATRADAQSPNEKIAVTTEVREIKITGDSLFIDTGIIVSHFTQPSSYELVLTPVICDRENRIELAPVVLSGKRRVQLDRRLLALKRQPRVADPYARYLTDKNNADYTIDYRAAVPYEPWMPGASLVLLAGNCGCGNEKAALNQTLLAELPVPGYEYKPALAFITPPEEEVRHRVESSAAYVIFEAGKAVLIAGLANNAAELDKIRASVEYVKEEPTAMINSISITANASPDGPESYNLDLSRRRAAALREYVTSVYDFQADIIHAKGIGEDWVTLANLIAGDNRLENREQIKRIIATVQPLDSREAQIKAIDGGKPYRYLRENCFPQLRRSDCRISYTVPELNIEKAKEVLRARPEILRLEEMYRIAATYEEGSDQFKEVFDIAVRFYPEDRIANLNAAAAALVRKDAGYAGRFLKGYENDPEAWNSFGVLHILLGQYEEAESYLNRAVAAGSAEARENLGQLGELKRVQRFSAR